MFFTGFGPGNPWKRSAAKFCSLCTNYQPISLDTDLFRTPFLYFVELVLGRFPELSQIRGPNLPTCQSRNIAFQGLSGAFASVPPRRVSIDEPIFKLKWSTEQTIHQPGCLKSGSGGLNLTSTFFLRYGVRRRRHTRLSPSPHPNAPRKKTRVGAQRSPTSPHKLP